MDLVRVGIIGYGYAGRAFHSYLVPLSKGLALEAIVSSSPDKRQRITQDRGCRAVASVDELLADPAIDLVVLATPHDTHADLAIRALRAGKHVVTDKVMALTTEEADAMIAAARTSGRMLSVFHNRRWDWDYQTVRHVIGEGLLGKPYLFECAVMQDRLPGGWRRDPERSGGMLHDWGAHLIDHGLSLVSSKVVEVFCSVVHATADVAVGNLAKLVLRFEDGTLYEVCLGNMARQSKPRWFVLGDRGSLRKEGLDPQEVAMNRGNIDAATEDPALRAVVRTKLGDLSAEIVVDSVRSSWRSYYDNISAHLNEGAPLAVTAESARRVVAVLDAAAAAIRGGHGVSVSI